MVFEVHFCGRKQFLQFKMDDPFYRDELKNAILFPATLFMFEIFLLLIACDFFVLF